MWGSHAAEKNPPQDVFTGRNSVLLGAIGSARQALLKVGWGKGVVSPGFCQPASLSRFFSSVPSPYSLPQPDTESQLQGALRII